MTGAKSTVQWTPTGTNWNGQEAPNLAQNNCKEMKLLLPYCKEKRSPLHLKQISYNPSTVSHPSDPSSSSIPALTNSYLASLPTALVLIEQKNPKQFVKKQLPPYFSTLQNHKDQTAMEVFTETHIEQAIRAKWPSKASQSCSVVATLIISVVFATMATVPGGLIQEQQDRGLPVYKGKLAVNVFSVSSLSTLCFSSISLIMFLNILTSPYQDSDIGNNLANKLILGLGSLFISIMAMFLSFFSGDLFVLDSKMKYIAYPKYVLTSCVVLAGFLLYSEIVKMVVTGIPTSTRQCKSSF